MPSPVKGKLPILVRKYGGSSLASVGRIRAVARALVAKRAEGYDLVVVVSAMGRTTDDLGHLARQVTPDPPRRELDMLLSVGERITMSLLSMALQAEGCSAISFTGSQCGIITDCSHTDARVLEVRPDRVREALDGGHVVIVAGFQGVSREREITTLGRGGSDTSAVALAAALGAERCEILKDVDGVFTADPHKVPDARRHDVLSYEEMARIAGAGSEVIHERAVTFARDNGVPLFVASSFHDAAGTLIGDAAPPPAAAAAADPCPPPAWRPLSMVVSEDVALIEVAAPDAGGPWRERLDGAAGADGLLAEWLEEDGDELVWGALVAGPLAAALHAAAAPVADESGGRCRFQRGLSCVNIAGPPPRHWLAALRQVEDVLREQGVVPRRVRAEGSLLRLLLLPADAARLLEPLHAALF